MITALPTLAPYAWMLLACAAFLVGISKTAIPGINTVSIAIFAAILPARASTGALLLLLIVGDVFALITYRRHADWRTLVKLIPAVIAGLIAGALFLAFAEDGVVRRFIGIILLLVIGFTLWRRSRPAHTPQPSQPNTGRFGRAAYGSLGGFTTMVANAGGPVMSMYFLAARFPVQAFLGTAAWFFAVLNIAKLPISAGLGLITTSTLALDLVLAPMVVVGACLGIWVARRIRQSAFNVAVIVCTIAGAVYLLI